MSRIFEIVKPLARHVTNGMYSFATRLEMAEAVVNSAFASDLFTLSRDRLMLRIGVDSVYWISPSILTRSLQKTNNSFIIFADFTPKIGAFESHATSVFIDEILKEGKKAEETTLYRQVVDGVAVRRYLEGGNAVVKSQLTSADALNAYYERCMRLAEHIAKNGVIDVHSARGKRELYDSKNDDNIGIGIDPEGGLMHYRKGHHRLAISRVLSIASVPVSLQLISGIYLSRFIDRPLRLTPNRLVSAITAAVNSAMRAYS
jgi:hypothetical protein